MTNPTRPLRSVLATARRPLPWAVAGATLLSAFACGDPLATSTYRGDPLFGVHGAVTQSLEPAPTADLEVGVLWLRGDNENHVVHVEAKVTETIGSTLPADYNLALRDPPSETLLGNGVAAQDGIDPARAAYGVLVVADAGAFAALPSTIDFVDLLPHGASPASIFGRMAYVSPYTIRYVKDAERDGLTVINGDGAQVALRDFSLFDISGWASLAQYNLCADGVTGAMWESEAVVGCIAAQSDALAAADAAQQECLSACPQDDACAFDCLVTHNGRQVIENDCVSAAAAPLVVEQCGAEAPVVDATIRELDPSADLILQLGDNDIRDVLEGMRFIFLG